MTEETGLTSALKGQYNSRLYTVFQLLSIPLIKTININISRRDPVDLKQVHKMVSSPLVCACMWRFCWLFKKSRNTPSVRVQAEFRPGEMWSFLQILNYKILHWISRIHFTSLHCDLCNNARKGGKSKNTASHQCSINSATDSNRKRCLLCNPFFHSWKCNP